MRTFKGFLNYSEVESNRFRKKIYRGNIEKVETGKLLNEIISNRVDISIFRIPAENSKSVYDLNSFKMPYTVADTLVYYYADLNNYQSKELRNDDLVFIKCDKSHKLILNQLVSQIFIEYKNHYFSNPFLDLQDINEGYQEWVRSYTDNKNNDCVSWLLMRDNKPIGFATCHFDLEKDECEGVLYGVVPEESGGGVYSDIIRFTQNYFKNKGFSNMKVSTQVHNFAVQKVWAREGFVLKTAFNTIHINSFMTYTERPKGIYNLNTSKLTNNSYGNQALNDTMILNHIIQNYILNKEEYNELKMNCQYRFIESLSNNNCKLEITYPIYNKKDNIFMILIKLIDSNEKIIMYAYINLIK